MKKLTIKENIDNIVDELNRCRTLLTEIKNKEDVSEDVLNELIDDIDDTLLYDLDLFKERIDLSLLMSAAIGDVSISTCSEIYDIEAKYELPVENGVIDTEEVYNKVDSLVVGIIKDLN
jgi:hypothetical protein